MERKKTKFCSEQKLKSTTGTDIAHRHGNMKVKIMITETSNNSLTLVYYELGYLRDSKAGAHSADSDIFQDVTHLPVRSKTYSNLYFLKQRLSLSELFKLFGYFSLQFSCHINFIVVKSETRTDILIQEMFRF